MLRRGNSMPSNSLDARSCFASYHFDPVQCDRSMLFADRTFDGALTCCMAPPPVWRREYKVPAVGLLPSGVTRDSPK
jgi:hypothetical protein